MGKVTITIAITTATIVIRIVVGGVGKAITATSLLLMGISFATSCLDTCLATSTIDKAITTMVVRVVEMGSLETITTTTTSFTSYYYFMAFVMATTTPIATNIVESYA